MDMIKVVEMISPKVGVPAQFFHDHWRHPHASWGLMVKSVKGYTQAHRSETLHLPPEQTRFEGVAEIWFESVDDCLNLSNDPAYRNYLEPDHMLFADMDLSIHMCTNEEVIQSAPSSTEIEGNGDFAWRLDQHPVSTKLMQMIEAEGDEPWAGAEDLELGLRIGAARHVRLHPHPILHAEGSPVLGFRELYWPTYTDFETGIRRDPEAFRALLDRPANSYAGLFSAERFPI